MTTTTEAASGSHTRRAGPSLHARRHAVAGLWFAFLISLESLARNKARAVLATLGIILGVGCVITMMALGTGTAIQMQEQIRSMGSNVLSVRSAERRVGSVRLSRQAGSNLTMEDYRRILERCPAVIRAAPRVDQEITVEYQRENNRTDVVGTTPDMLVIRNFRLAAGRTFFQAELERRARVCIIGPELVEDLFKEEDPIGQRIMVKNQPFRVIGVTRPHGSGDDDWDDRMFVPVSTAMERLFGTDEVERIEVQARDEEMLFAATKQVEVELRRSHHLREDQENDFEIRTSQEAIERAEEASAVLTAFLAGIASVSLLVGGLGIMNVMLISVMERTREIGVRRAVGARRGDIMSQFLLESLLMCGLGGGLGVAAGFAACLIGATYLGWPVVITLDSIALATTFAVVTGLFFGLYPAFRAAHLSPLSALRVE